MSQSRTRNKIAPAVLTSLALCLLLGWANAQSGSDVLTRFHTTEAMIPARDGVRLHTLIYAPKDAREPLPIIMLRTPYGIDGRAGGAFASYFKELVAEGYICSSAAHLIRSQVGKVGLPPLGRLHIETVSQSGRWACPRWTGSYFSSRCRDRAGASPPSRL